MFNVFYHVVVPSTRAGNATKTSLCKDGMHMHNEKHHQRTIANIEKNIPSNELLL
jgi:hypothetical protein